MRHSPPQRPSARCWSAIDVRAAMQDPHSLGPDQSEATTWPKNECGLFHPRGNESVLRWT